MDEMNNGSESPPTGGEDPSKAGSSNAESKDMMDYLVRKGQLQPSASTGNATSDVTDGTSASKTSDMPAGAEGTSLTAKPYNVDRVRVRTAAVPAAPEYGNYFTVSGVSADALRKTFAKSLRPSGDAKSRRLLASGVRFSSPKDSICEDEVVESSDASHYRNRSDSKGFKDLFFNRRRIKSGSAQMSVDSSTDSKKGGARVRTFFDSFRSRPRSISVSSACPEVVVIPPPSAATPPPAPQTVGKKKKFKVTPTSLLPSLKKAEQPRMGPEEFVDMFCRARSGSDPRADKFLKAKDVATAHKKLLQQQQQQQVQQRSFRQRSETLHDERRLSDPATDEISLLNATTSNYATVTGLSALRLANYPKLQPKAPFSEDHSNRVVEPVRMIIWKDKKKGTKVFRLPGYYENYLGSGSEELVFVRFAKSKTCYDVMPFSSKLVVFDTQLNVKKAFLSLVQNGVRAAVLWDAKRQDFVGMLTVTDFLQILQKYYRSSPEHIAELEAQKIATWRDVLGENDLPLVSVGPSDSLFTAIENLWRGKVHRLLVVNPVTGNPLHVLTYKRILRFIHITLRNLPQTALMRRTLSELQIGSYDDVAKATLDTPLIDVLNLFVNRRISALPIVDDEERVVDIYTKFDVMDLISEQNYSNLDLTINEAIKSRHEGCESLRTCKKSDTLFQILENIVGAEVHRLVVVDSDNKLEGLVSLSDLFKFMVIDPYDHLESAADHSPAHAADVDQPTGLTVDTAAAAVDISPLHSPAAARAESLSPLTTSEATDHSHEQHQQHVTRLPSPVERHHQSSPAHDSAGDDDIVHDTAAKHVHAPHAEALFGAGDLAASPVAIASP